MKSVHLLIKGDVQGVFFRATAKKVADKLQLAGWIKNTPGGDVEAVISGNDKSVAEFIEWSKKGPDRAIVEDVTIKDSEEINFSEFKIIRHT